MNDDVLLDPKDLEGKYLTFNLMEEYYGVNVKSIQQIIKVVDITMIPKTPEFVKGVINLRGKIIPVIDLRLKFKLPLIENTDRTSIIIINIKSDHGVEDVCIGVIVDKVNEVLDIDATNIEKAPTFGVDIDTHFIHGMAKVKNKVVTLLNIGRVLTSEELSTLANSTKQ